MPVVAAPAQPQLPPVLLELRSFLMSKKLVEPAKIDQLLATRNTDDAAALISGLAVLGLVTQVQADALLGEFHQRQMSLARGVVDTAHARGFIPASHIEQALGSYAPMSFGVSIHDHLVGSGLLTREQAGGLQHRNAAGAVSRRRLGAVALGFVVLVVIVLASKCGGGGGAKQGDRMQGLGVAITVVRSIMVKSFDRRLVKVTFKVENTGKKVLSDLRSKWFVLEDGQGHRFKPVAGYDVENLQPLDSVTHSLMYELPSAADATTLTWGAVIEGDEWGIHCTLTPETKENVPPGFDRL